MGIYRITYQCEMRNTPKKQAEIDAAKASNEQNYYYLLDATRNYTESLNCEAESQEKAYIYGCIDADKKTAKYFNEDGTQKEVGNIWGFTVKYSVKPDDVVFIGETTINDDAKAFHYSFAIDRTRVFEVNYYRCGNNRTMYFATSASQFNRPKTDWRQGGQAQEILLPKGSKARTFFNKWDSRHLKELGDTEYKELIKDIEVLKSNYWYINNGVSFNGQKNLSMIISQKYSVMGGNKSEKGA